MKNCRTGGKSPKGLSETCETLRRPRLLVWFQVPAQLAAPVRCSVTNTHGRRSTTNRKCTAIRDFEVGVYTGCFFFCLTDKRQPKVPPALRHTSHVGEI